MNFTLRFRLSFMMFTEYFIWGAWYVTLGTWLTASLHFSAQQVGLAAGATAVGAIFSPFLVGLVADRLFRTQRVLAFSHFIGAALLFAASRQTSFVPFYSLVLAYCFCFMPTLALTNSLAFRHMNDPREQFGAVRVLGSVGWIVAGLLVGILRIEPTAVPMRVAAIAALAMGFYCLTLPDTRPLSISTGFSLRDIFPRETVSLLRERSMFIFALASFLICVPLQFYYAFTNVFLNQLSVANAAGKMTAGQISELLCMVLIPTFFRKLGVKYMLAVGMFAWVARYLLFAFGDAGPKMWMLWAGILLHGACYDFFFVIGQIFVDRKAPVNLRASAQGLITFITYGLGMFVGSWLSGAVVNHYALAATQVGSTFDWKSIWLFSSATSAIVLTLFVLSFSDRDVTSTRELPDPEESPLLMVANNSLRSADHS